MIFKIYGERNSGTTFLTDLLKKNFNNIQVIPHNKINKKYVSGWKHGPPSKIFKNNNIIDIIIFRDLHTWLLSMFNNPYHLNWDNPEKNFKRFLTKKHTSETVKTSKWFNIENKLPLSIDDDNKTIFEIRYFKYEKIIEYYNENTNVTLVNLYYLQNNENCKHFIKNLQKKYNLPDNTPKLINRHVKTTLMIKNRKYNTDITKYMDIIDKYKNNTIEDNINKLEFKIK